MFQVMTNKFNVRKFLLLQYCSTLRRVLIIIIIIIIINQNKLFRTDCKKFYNRLRQTYPNVNNASGKEEVENFWRKIYGEK